MLSKLLFSDTSTEFFVYEVFQRTASLKYFTQEIMLLPLSYTEEFSKLNAWFE